MSLTKVTYSMIVGDVVSPIDFGAVGNGITDDTTAILAALNSGKVVDGGNATYAVTGQVTPTSFVGLRNATLKQLAPTTSNCKTLYLDSFSNFFLDNVSIDRNGGLTVGNIQNYGGLWIVGCDNFQLNSVKAYNGGPGNGITVWQSSYFSLTDCVVKDLTYNLSPAPTDDVIDGFWFSDCNNFSVIGCQVRDLTSSTGTNVYTRGFAFGGTTAVTVTGCVVDNVDQCYDFTGSIGNSHFVVGDSVASNGGSVGFKFANSAYSGAVSNCTASDCGYFGFVVSGPTEVSNPNPQDITFTNCVAINTGSNGRWVLSNPVGFKVDRQPDVTNYYPAGIRFVDCTVVDNQVSPTTIYGFQNTVYVNTYPTTGYNQPDSNICVNCTVRGIADNTKDFDGINFPLVRATGSTGTIGLANNTWTDIDIDQEGYDPSGLHSTVTNTANIIVKIPGMYVVHATGQISSNASGTRGLRFLRNGAALDPYFYVHGYSAGDTYIQGTIFVQLDVGSTIRMQLWQDSGSSLNAVTQGCSLQIVKVG